MARNHSGVSWQSFSDGIRWLLSGFDIGGATLGYLAPCIACSCGSSVVVGCAWDSILAIVDHVQKIQAQR